VGCKLTQPLAGLIPALLLQCFGYLSVKPGAAGGPEILIEGVLDQRVGEREAPGPL
jgi:hypothetical protein